MAVRTANGLPPMGSVLHRFKASWRGEAFMLVQQGAATMA